MSRKVDIFILRCGGVFRDVFASYSEAVRESHGGSCCVIERVVRESY